MNIALWVLQVLLAVAFFAHGWLFLAPPPEGREMRPRTHRQSGSERRRVRDAGHGLSAPPQG